MYYEETVIDNVLHWRGRPDGEWKRVTDSKQLAIHYMRLLSGDDRLSVISTIGSDTRKSPNA